ncbi:hypothetical protein QQF64_027029 [Cirrhinus molitorella]|uniref:Uncharacterized protein n=1 Tax=Cirrhinus molitorella TaxID=172907 RepID=A0ABR3NB71_9TELE
MSHGGSHGEAPAISLSASERFCSGKLILICTLDWRPTNNFDLRAGDGDCPPEVFVLSASKLLRVKMLHL